MRERRQDVDAVEKRFSLRKSDSVLAGPLASSRLVPGTVSLVDVGDLGHQRVVGVGICEHRADGKEDYID